MSSSKGKPPGRTPRDAERTAGEPKSSGRVAFDSRGNPVWEWETSTGVYDKNVSTQRLKTLEATELSLEQTQALAEKKKLEIEKGGVRGGGINPYDSTQVPSPPTAPKAAAKSSSETFHPAMQRNKPKSASLVSKYAATHRSSAREAAPPTFWEKIKGLFTRGK